MFLCWEARTTLIYGHKDKWLAFAYGLHLFNKFEVIGPLKLLFFFFFFWFLDTGFLCIALAVLELTF